MPDLSETTLKAGVVAALAATCIGVGMWIGSSRSDVDALAAAQAAGQEAVQVALARIEVKLDQNSATTGQLQRDVAVLDARLKTAEQDRRRLETELRLLKDFTEGRIGDTPYRGGGQ